MNPGALIRPRALRGLPAAGVPGSRSALGEQALVAAGQLAAGVGNFVFALVAAQLLAPGAFADLAAFLALYLVVHVPLSSLAAGSALTPELAARFRRRAMAWGGVGAMALALAAVPLGAVLGVPAVMLAVLAAGVPAAGLLALERGRLYGEGAHGRAAASLAVEPLLRVGLGVPLALVGGATGGALGVVAGGWAAVAVTAPWRARKEEGRSTARGALAGAASTGLAAAAFLALAAVQNQDVVLANALLAGGEAGTFAVVSTIGGVAAFATSTIPFVLLPRARRGDRGALAAALAAALALGGAATAAVALVPEAAFTAAFGEAYGDLRALAVPYVGAMALLGVARVLVAHRVAGGAARSTLALVAGLAIVQTAAIVTLADRPAALVTVTALTALALLGVTAGAEVLRLPRSAAAARDALALLRRPSRTALALGALTVLALVLRLLADRGIWLDEATSIAQTQLPLTGLLGDLRTTDVHPPLHHVTLWVLASLLGTEELVMRAPSLLAGTALVPVLYALGAELYDRRAGLLAAALGALAPFVIWYSQEARMYALFMLFAAVAVLAQLRVLRTGKRRDWVLYTVATVALLWTQYFGLLLAAVQQVGFLLAARHRRGTATGLGNQLKPWLLTTALIAVACLPLVPLALEQFQANQAAGRGFGSPSQAGTDVTGRSEPGVYLLITNIVWAVGGYHSDATMGALGALWPLGMLGGLALLGRGRSPRTLLVVACALVPALILMVAGVFKPFVFEVRYFAGAVPLLLVLIARAATGWARRTAIAGVVSALLLGGLGVAFADQQLNRANPRVYAFEEALATVEDFSRPGDVTVYEPFYLREVIEYYQADLRAAPLQDGLPEERYASRVIVFSSFLEQPRHREATAAALRALSRQRGEPVRELTFPQVRVWVFE